MRPRRRGRERPVSREVARTEEREADLTEQRDHGDVEEREPPPPDGHAPRQIEDPSERQRTNEAACITRHRVERQRGAPPPRVRAARRPRRERGGIEPDEQAVDQDEHSGKGIGARAEEADDRAARDADRHGQAHEPLPS